MRYSSSGLLVPDGAQLCMIGLADFTICFEAVDSASDSCRSLFWFGELVEVHQDPEDQRLRADLHCQQFLRRFHGESRMIRLYVQALYKFRVISRSLTTVTLST